MGLSGPFADAAATLDLSDDVVSSEPAATPAAPSSDPAPTSDPPAAPPPTDPAPEPTPSSEAFTRDGMGRLHRPDGTIASKAEADAYTAAHPVAPEAPAPVAEAEAAEPVAAQPYIFASHDKPFIDGALIHPETGDIFVPAAKRDELERFVMRGARYDEMRDKTREAVQRADVAEKRGPATVSALIDALPMLHTKDAFFEFLEAASRSPEAADLAFDRLNLSIDRQMDAVDRQFGPQAKTPLSAAPVGNDTPPSAAIDRDEATEALTDYFRDQMALPEFKGMTSDLRQYVWESLVNANALVRDRDGDLALKEAAVAGIWGIAKQAMRHVTTAARATEFNTSQATRASATSAAPPSVAAGKPRVGAPAASVASGRDPMLNPKTGKPWDDPYDAIKYAF